MLDVRFPVLQMTIQVLPSSYLFFFLYSEPIICFICMLAVSSPSSGTI